MHVADGVDVDQESDPGDDEQHDDRERVELKGDVRADAARVEPVVDDIDDPLAVRVGGAILKNRDRPEHRRAERSENGHRGDERLPRALSEQSVHHEAGEREDGDEPEGIQHAR